MAQDPPWTKHGKNRTKIHNLDVQFPQRLKSTFLRFFSLFYSLSTDPMWTISPGKGQTPKLNLFSNLNPPWAQQQHWAINIPNTQQGIFKYNFQMLCLLHGFTWPRKTFSALNDMSCVYFIQHLPNFKGQIEGHRNKNLGSASSMSFVTNWSQSKY